MRLACVGLLAIATTLVISACGSGSSPSAGSPTGSATSAAGAGNGGTLVIGMTAVNIPPLDTVLSGAQGNEGFRLVGNQIYDALTRYDLQQSTEIPTLEPGLATSWKSNADATEWTFKLRDGVSFTDGTPWNADAAVFNFKRYTDPESKYSSPELVGQAACFAGIIESVEMIDERTIRVNTVAPDSHLPEDLNVAYMASPTALKKNGMEGFAAHPVGTGPFMFSSAKQGQELTLVPNDDYWRGAPKLDQLVLKPVPDPTARIAALRSGSVNWIEYPQPDDIASLESEGFQVLSNSYDHIWAWVLNGAAKPWSDPRVRQAVNYAIDREAMASSLLHETAEPAEQVAPRANSAYDPANDIYGYDPEKAKQLLREAGYPDGFTMTVEYPTAGSGNLIPGPMNEALQQELAAVGIDVKLKPTEWSTLIADFVSGELPPGVDAINASLTFQPEAYWQLVLGSEGPINNGGYSNPKVDALLAKAQATVDPAARATLYAEASALITRDAPWLFVVNDRNPRALAPTVHGFVEPKSWFIDLTTVSVK